MPELGADLTALLVIGSIRLLADRILIPTRSVPEPLSWAFGIEVSQDSIDHHSLRRISLIEVGQNSRHGRLGLLFITSEGDNGCKTVTAVLAGSIHVLDQQRNDEVRLGMDDAKGKY